jgi:hypothetical protein
VLGLLDVVWLRADVRADSVSTGGILMR